MPDTPDDAGITKKRVPVLFDIQFDLPFLNPYGNKDLMKDISALHISDDSSHSMQSSHIGQTNISPDRIKMYEI